jgi:hypothetical protein
MRQAASISVECRVCPRIDKDDFSGVGGVKLNGPLSDSRMGFYRIRGKLVQAREELCCK